MISFVKVADVNKLTLSLLSVYVHYEAISN